MGFFLGGGGGGGVVPATLGSYHFVCKGKCVFCQDGVPVIRAGGRGSKILTLNRACLGAGLGSNLHNKRQCKVSPTAPEGRKMWPLQAVHNSQPVSNSSVVSRICFKGQFVSLTLHLC